MIRAYLPSASQGTVDGSEPCRRAGLRHRQVVLRSVEVLLCGQHGRKIPCAEIILQQCDTERSARRGDALAQKVDLLAALQKTGQPVFDLLLRLQHRVLIIDEQGLQPRVLDPDRVRYLPAIENIPLHSLPYAPA